MAASSAPEHRPLFFRIPHRCHMSLVGDSPFTRLIRHGSFVTPPEGFIAALHQDLNRLALRDMPGLPIDTLKIEAARGSFDIAVDMRNTQFIAADRTPGAFADGYEPDVLAAIDLLVDDAGTFIDVGANWGYMALHCVLRQEFRGQAIAIEPGTRPRGDLQAVVAACGLAPCLQVLPFAIGEHHGTALLSQPPWSGTATTIGTTEGETVDVRSFDELDLPAADLIKVDVEGGEAAFVRGARDYLTRHRSPVIFESRVDTPGGDWASPYALFAALGYSCFAVDAQVARPPGQAASIELALHPATAGNRGDFPVHLNVLAIADRSVLEVSPFRVQTPQSCDTIGRQDTSQGREGNANIMTLPTNCAATVALLQAIGLHEPYDWFHVAGLEADIQGWGHDDPIFEYVMQHWHPRLILEVGSWKGASAIKMAELQKQLGIDGLIVCIDTWLGSNASLWHDPTTRSSLRLRDGYPSIFLQFVKNLVASGHGDHIRYMPMTSTCAAELLADAGIQADAIYIDAGHLEHEVYIDIRCYYPLLRPGGILFGDDYSASWPGTVRAVNRFVAEEGLKLISTEWKWLVQKPEITPAASRTAGSALAIVSAGWRQSQEAGWPDTDDAPPQRHGGAANAALQAENQRLRAELASYRTNAEYEDWFNQTFSVAMRVPNTWPFTTFAHGTPWCDKVAYGMQDAEILFVQDLLEKIVTDNVPGGIVEFGTYYGHWVQVIAETLEARGWQRELWGFDSFEGLPKSQPGVNLDIWTEGRYAAPFEEVRQRLQVDQRPWLHLVKGWFNNTLAAEPATSIRQIAYARIDGALHESCVECLRYLEGRLSDGAILVFNNWQFAMNLGETLAFREWISRGVPYRFEYLGFNMWAHLYLRVHHVR